MALARREAPQPSPVDLVLLVVSIGAMFWLARAKRRVATSLGSSALRADAFQTTACWWLSLTARAELGLKAKLRWWWADPLAALAMTVFLVREAWRGEECGRVARAADGQVPIGQS